MTTSGYSILLKVYKNILLMVSRRGYILSIDDRGYVESEFNSEEISLSREVVPLEYYSNKGERKLLVYIYVGTDFKQFIDSIINKIRTDTENYEEIIFVERVPNGQKGGRVIIDNSREGGFRLRYFPLDNFYYDLTSNALQPREFSLHRRDSKEHSQLTTLLKSHNAKITDIYNITNNDPIASYYGARPGDIFRVVDDNVSNVKGEDPQMVNTKIYYLLVTGLVSSELKEEEIEEEQQDEPEWGGDEGEAPEWEGGLEGEEWDGE